MPFGDDSGNWSVKFDFGFLLVIFLSTKIITAGNWSCVARVVPDDSNLPESEGNLYGGGLWLENIVYLVPGQAEGAQTKWVQHTQLIAIPCMLATYFTAKQSPITLKDGVEIPKPNGEQGVKLQPLKWSAGVQVSALLEPEKLKLVATSASEAIDVSPANPATTVVDVKDVVGQTQLRVRARFQAANYQFIYRFDLSDDGKITFGIELTGKTAPEQPYVVHLHQLVAVLVPGKDFVASYVVQHNPGTGSNPFAALPAAPLLTAKLSTAGWKCQDDGVLAFVAAPQSANLTTWPHGDAKANAPLGTGLLWWFDPPTSHSVGQTYPGYYLPDLIALDFAQWQELAVGFPVKYPAYKIARVAWYAGLNENVDNKKAWQALASKFGIRMKSGKLPVLFSVLRHLHFPQAPEDVLVAGHYVSQSVRLRGRPG